VPYREYALGIEEEARPIAPPARGVHFVDQDQEAQASRPHSPDHADHTYELTQRVGQLVDVLYLNRLGEGQAPPKQTPPPGGPSGPDYRCFNCDEPGHWARECPKPKANTRPRTKKFCKFHRTSTHDDSECKRIVRGAPPPVQDQGKPAPSAPEPDTKAT
jgi:hypothetical protein